MLVSVSTVYSLEVLAAFVKQWLAAVGGDYKLNPEHYAEQFVLT